MSPDAMDRLHAERTLYNLLARTTGQRRVAKRVLARLREGPPDSGLSGELVRARDFVREELAPEAYARTLFARGEDGFVLDPGSASASRPETEGGAGTDLGALAPDHRAVLELLFVDRRPVPEVCDLYGITQDRCFSFLADVVQTLGDVSRIEHQCREAPAVPDRIRYRLRRHLEPGSGEPDPPAGDPCLACRQIDGVADQAIDLLGEDHRLLSFDDGSQVRRALRAPRVKEVPAVAVRPAVNRPGAGPVHSTLRKVRALPGILAAGLGLLLVAGLRLPSLSTPAEAVTATVRGRGDSCAVQEAVRDGARRDLIVSVGALLRAPHPGPLVLDLRGGARLTLTAGSLVRIEEHGLTLLLGQGTLRSLREIQPPLAVLAGTARERFSRGELRLERTPERGSSIVDVSGQVTWDQVGATLR